MKVALCFWGLTRSLKYTIQSIQDKVINILKNATIKTTKNGEQVYEIIQITTFLHTYQFKSKYFNPRANEIDVEIDFEEYKLLNPDFVQIDDQDEIKKQLNLQQYRTHKDPWKSDYICVDNFICAMYSKQQLGKMMAASGQEFDRVIFLRPDVKYLNNFDVSWLSAVSDNLICIPNFALFPDFNDRFCVTNSKNAEIYCNLMTHMLAYSKNTNLHSERFHSYCLRKIYGLKMVYLPFYFNRVRCNGFEENDSTNEKHKSKTVKMSYHNPIVNILSSNSNQNNTRSKINNNSIMIMRK